MTDAVLDVAFNKLIVCEGGYVDNPKDPGGETKYGVCKRSYPDLDIKNLTLEKAKEIYCKDYWDRCKCNLLPDCLAIIVADTAYNSGCNKAIKLLQKTLGIKEDGIIGNQTLCAANACNRKKTVDSYIENRLNFLQSLRTWSTFGRGWTNRCEEVKNFAEQYI